tara:strand:- start:981 stop:1556 length:576 start_codon:yes stop_codon:yes gene_type:complete
MDFFEELMISISENKDPIDNDRLCLITNELLIEPIIILECNHSFNYDAILNEVINQKIKKNNLETQLLTRRQIKCPYCRKIQNKLLPLLENNNEILGVNSPSKYCMLLYKCNYFFKGGKKKNLRCNKPCNKIKCTQHMQIQSKIKKNANNNLENKIFCKALVKSGKRMGLHCLNGVKENGYCMIHKKIYTN